MSFRIGRTVFELSFPLVGIMTAVILLDTSMSVLLCFAAAIMHELGHLAAMRYYGCIPDRIKLTLFDIAITDRKKVMRNSSHNLVITLAGVAVNFISAVICYIIFSFTGNSVLQQFFASHLTLGLFNSLPVDTLDGGQALLLILTRFFSPDTSEKILMFLSVMVLIPAACLGFLILLQTKYNFTLLLAALYLTAVILYREKPRRNHRDSFLNESKIY